MKTNNWKVSLIIVFSMIVENNTETEKFDFGIKEEHLVQLSEMEKMFIIGRHNRYRALVAKGQKKIKVDDPLKGVPNMLEMVWDNGLEAEMLDYMPKKIYYYTDPPEKGGNNMKIFYFMHCTFGAEGPNRPKENWWLRYKQTSDDYILTIPNFLDKACDYFLGRWTTSELTVDSRTAYLSLCHATNRMGCAHYIFRGNRSDEFVYTRRAKIVQVLFCKYQPVVCNTFDDNPKGSPNCGSYGLSDSSHWPGLCVGSGFNDASGLSDIPPLDQSPSPPDDYKPLKYYDLPGMFKQPIIVTQPYYNPPYITGRHFDNTTYLALGEVGSRQVAATSSASSSFIHSLPLLHLYFVYKSR